MGMYITIHLKTLKWSSISSQANYYFCLFSRIIEFLCTQEAKGPKQSLIDHKQKLLDHKQDSAQPRKINSTKEENSAWPR